MKGVTRMLLKMHTRIIFVALVFILLSLLYSRQEQGVIFRMDWIWHDQPIYHITSPVTHTGLPWSYISTGGFKAPPAYKPGFAFLSCDKTACIFDLPWSRRLFLYHFNILLDLIFWCLVSWLVVFAWEKFKKRAHSSAGSPR